MLDQMSFGSMDRWQEREVVVPRSGRPLELAYHLVQDGAQLERMVAVLSATRDITHDTESNGLTPALGARAIGHSFAAMTRPPSSAAPAEISLWYVPIRHVGTPEPQLPVELVSRAVAAILGSSGRCGWAHGKHDWAISYADGIWPTREKHDVLALANLWNENEQNFKLKHLADKYAFPGAAGEEKQLEDFMRRDARALGLKYKQRKSVGLDDVEEIEEPTYMERFGFSRTPIHLCGRYACRDVLYTLYLWLVQYAGVARQFAACYGREMALSEECLFEMEWFGLPVNEALIRDVQERTAEEVAYWLEQVQLIVGDRTFTAQEDELRALLYERMALPVPKWTGGGKGKKRQASVDLEARKLLRAAHAGNEVLVRLLDGISRLTDAQKFHGTYSASFLRYYAPATGCVYPSYNALERRERGVPVTGRLSSEKPNVQNIAHKTLEIGRERGKPFVVNVQRYFIVPDGFVRLYADFSQIELRVLAWFCQDPNLLRAYPVIGDDLDVHQITSDLLAISRHIAKQCNFLTVYGGTEMALATRMPGYWADPEGTREEAKVIIGRFFEQYRAIKVFEAEFARQMRLNNCSFVNPFGRPRRIPDIAAYEQWKRASATRRMMSSIISGTSADLMKECMLRTRRWLRPASPPSRLKQSIHDELVFDLELPRWQQLTLGIKALMEDWPMFTQGGPHGRGQGVGIKVGCAVVPPGGTWADKKKLKIEGGRILNPEVIA